MRLQCDVMGGMLGEGVLGGGDCTNSTRCKMMEAVRAYKVCVCVVRSGGRGWKGGEGRGKTVCWSER